jgi:hypothetical protein
MSGDTFETMAEGELIAKFPRRRDFRRFLVGRHQ